MSDHFEHLIFPSGRTVRACKADAKKLRASAKINGEQLSHASALDFVSAQNGLKMSWHQAIELLKKQSLSSVHVEPKTLYSPCRSVSSTVITDVQTSSSDESIAGYIEGMPSLELPHILKNYSNSLLICKVPILKFSMGSVMSKGISIESSALPPQANIS
jgi:hypothetical protein